MLLKNEIDSYWTSFSNDYISHLLTAYQQLEIDDNDFTVTEEYYEDLEAFFEQSYQWDISEEHVEQIIGVAKVLPTKILMYYMNCLSQENTEIFHQFYTTISDQSNEDCQYLLERCICFEKCQIVAKVMCYDHLLLLEKVLTQAMDESL